MIKPDWENLREGRCPICKEVIKRKRNENFKCECGFFCRFGRAKEILNDLNERDFDKPADDFLKKHGCYIPKN